VQALLIIFCVIAAIGGAHVSWWLTDTAIARMDVEPPSEWPGAGAPTAPARLPDARGRSPERR
jgi:hypothetical protein